MNGHEGIREPYRSPSRPLVHLASFLFHPLFGRHAREALESGSEGARTLEAALQGSLLDKDLAVSRHFVAAETHEVFCAQAIDISIVRDAVLPEVGAEIGACRSSVRTISSASPPPTNSPTGSPVSAGSSTSSSCCNVSTRQSNSAVRRAEPICTENSEMSDSPLYL